MHEAMSPEVRAALEQCRWMIRKGSKSFSLAAQLFDAPTRDAACFLYGWCRYCDDQVDRFGRAEDDGAMLARVEALKHSTASAFSVEPQREAVFVALQYIARRYEIPAHYALELIEGLAMDARGTRYPTFGELLVYCYRVAGTVGLMMSHVMGVRDEAALKHAADLGIGMQLTNIARDITEDAAMGRIYLPLDWLGQFGIAPQEIAQPKNREKLAALTQRLLAEAARFYRSGDQGLWHLSLRSACAVSAARKVYSEIGHLLLRKGLHAWDERTYVTGPRKIGMVLSGVLACLRSAPARIVKPWARAPIRIVWTCSEVH